jgi:hypothetical protein
VESPFAPPGRTVSTGLTKHYRQNARLVPEAVPAGCASRSGDRPNLQRREHSGTASARYSVTPQMSSTRGRSTIFPGWSATDDKAPEATRKRVARRLPSNFDRYLRGLHRRYKTAGRLASQHRPLPAAIQGIFLPVGGPAAREAQARRACCQQVGGSSHTGTLATAARWIAAYFAGSFRNVVLQPSQQK